MARVLRAGRTSSTRQARWRMTAAASATCLLIAACGGSDDETTIAPTTLTRTATPPSASPATRPTLTTLPRTPPTALSSTTTPPPTLSTVSPPAVTVDETALQAMLDEWRADVDAYGATLSIRVPGHADIQLASGIDDREITTTGLGGAVVEHNETPMPTDGTYNVDAVSRTFVAATAMQLVDEGRFSLDEPVGPWLPELPRANEITMAMLLGHTSGLGEWDALPAIIDDPTRSYTPEEVLANHLQQPVRGEPGGPFSLTDADTVAAGLMIQRELGQELAAVYEERLFKPLGLADTRFSDGSISPTRHGWFSFPDDPDPAGSLDMLDFPGQAARTALWASGSIDSSSQDMLDWGETLLSGDLLGEAATATLLEMRNANPLPFSDYYGLGVSGYCIDPECAPDEVELVGRSGALGGSRSLLVYHRDSGTTFMVHVNTALIEIPPLVEIIIDALEQLELT
jgi:D-alanyl-D-alanine carboxypeptidase